MEQQAIALMNGLSPCFWNCATVKFLIPIREEIYLYHNY